MIDKSKFRFYHLESRWPCKVEFSSLDDFLDDIAEADIDTVRLDVFEDVRPSALSFIHHVTWRLYVTARDATSWTVYEYAEPLAHLVASDACERDEAAMQVAQARVQQVQARFAGVVPRIRRGRYVVAETEME